MSSCCRRCIDCWRSSVGHLPLMARHHPVVTRWVSLVVGCIGMAASASVWQNSWQNAMRAIFNQTETEANVVATLGNVGGMTAFPAGLMYETFGSQMNAIIGFFLTGAGYLSLWIETDSWRRFVTNNLWVIDISYFLVGFSGSFMYMAVLLPNVENFPAKQRGKIIGILDASLSVGPTILTIMYNSIFSNGHFAPGEEDKQNLAGYFFSVAIITLVANVFIFLFVGPIPHHHHSRPRRQSASEEETLINEDTSNNNTAINNNDGDDDDDDGVILECDVPSVFSEHPFQELPLHRAIFRWNFWYLLFQLVLIGCVQITYAANIPTYLRSFNMNEHNMLFTSTNTAVQIASKFCAGVISDCVASRGRHPRTVVYLLPYFLQSVFLLISAFYGDNYYVLLTTDFVVGLTTGVTWCQTPTIMSELFGGQHLGSHWGMALLSLAVFGFPFSIGYSAIYQAAIIEPDSKYCYGNACFFWSSILFSACSFCALLLVIGLMQNMQRNAKDRRRSLMSTDHEESTGVQEQSTTEQEIVT